ncbi:MAG: DUF58 domain-containing protein [Anaerolineales bacterium]|nr:DUF58 domain-containing protein [Anaerolineales bacterium]
MKASSSVRWLLAVLLGVGLFGWAVTGSVVYVRLAYLGILLLAGAYVWTAVSIRGLSLSRSARVARASVGELFEETFEVANRTRQPGLWLEVENLSRLPNAEGSRLLTRIGGRETRTYPARTLLTRRGAFPLGPATISSGDPFGLFTVQKTFPAESSLIVLPMSVEISTFPIPPGLLPGGKAIRRKTMDVTPNAAGIREYVPGDPMKRIHWPSTVRRDRFMVKEFEQDPQSDLWLFLDAQARVHVRGPELAMPIFEVGQWLTRRPQINLPCDTFEYTVSIAASLARHFLKRNRAVGLACATGHFTVLSSERGERQIGKVLETLAFLEPQGEIPFLGLIQLQAKLLPLGSGVILITSSPTPELFLAVEDLQRRSLQPLVILIKPETFGGSGDSQPLTDALIGREVPVASISYGDNLAEQLALPAVYYEQHYRSSPAAYVSPI